MKKIILYFIVFLLIGNLIPIGFSTQNSQIERIKNSQTVQLEIEVITGGIGVSALIRNIGDEDATDINWSIELSGGIILIGKDKRGVLPKISANDSENIEIPFVLGLGKTTIAVTVEPYGGNEVKKIVKAMWLGLKI